MISRLREVQHSLEVLEEAHNQLQEESVPHLWPLKRGIMIEVPSTALLSELFAENLDFFSIGTNDLTQYTLAAERGNSAVAELQDTFASRSFASDAVSCGCCKSVVPATRANQVRSLIQEYIGDVRRSHSQLITATGSSKIPSTPARICLPRRLRLQNWRRKRRLSVCSTVFLSKLQSRYAASSIKPIQKPVFRSLRLRHLKSAWARWAQREEQ